MDIKPAIDQRPKAIVAVVQNVALLLAWHAARAPAAASLAGAR